MTKDEKIERLSREILHDKSCWYGAHRCSFPEARAKRDLERLLVERVTPHKELDAQEREAHHIFHDTGE